MARRYNTVSGGKKVILLDHDLPGGTCTNYGCETGTWLDFLTLIINKKISGEELRNMIFALPTQNYMIVSALVPLMKK